MIFMSIDSHSYLSSREGIPTESKLLGKPHIWCQRGVVSWGDPMRVAEMFDVQEKGARDPPDLAVGSGHLWTTVDEPGVHHG